ncbi:ribonuclease HII [Limnobacter sp.]|uniref:ribonuclease HII n=1 Tax=Limnobacter sp. TaxID=2003368 RepID=UPI00258F055F|nr:ribonuclease HII [Limnobacter sp.]
MTTEMPSWPEIQNWAKHRGLAIVGVDEAGRGPLFGPVVAGACLLAEPNPIDGLACSKTLSEKARVRLFDSIRMHSKAWAVGISSVEEIDELNILQASLLAMRRAVDQVVDKAGLNPEQCLVLVDGNKLPAWSYLSKSIVKGDALVPSISAGSIVAKVSRDEWCREQALVWPQYELDVHMGYPTPRHLELLRRHGASPLHRRSFRPVREVLNTSREVF